MIKNKIPDKLPNNFEDYLFGKKGKVSIKDDFNKYHSRQLYLNIEILSIIKYIVSKSIIDSPYMLTNGTWTTQTCCLDEISKDNNYIDYFIKLNNNLESLIVESFKNNTYNKYFVKTGTLSVLFPPVHKWLSISQVGDIEDEEIYNLLHLYYNYKGDYPGYKRIYMGEENNKYDIVSGKYMKDIKKVNFTKNDYDNLIQEIFKKNIIPPTIDIFKIKLEYKDFQGKDYQNKINSIGDKLTTILSESSEFKDDMKNLLNNIGINYDESEKFEHLKDNIKYKELKYVRRINNLKNYINNYFRKYLEMIKKKLRVATLPKYKFDDPDEQRAFFILMKGEIEFVEEFYKYSELFQDICFTCSAEEIYNMNGVKRTYCKDWTRVQKESPLSFKDVSEYLLYFLVSQLDSWLVKKESIESDNKTYTSISINNIISRFIVKILNKIKNNTNIFRLKDSYESFEQSLNHQMEDRYNMKYKKMSITQKEFKKELYDLDTDEQLKEKDQELQEQRINDKVINEEQTELAKEMISSREGREATAQEIEDFKEDMEDELDIDQEIQEEFDSTQVRSINMLTDIGDDYGEETQDIDPAGSMANETVFLTEMEQFKSHGDDGPPPYGQTSGPIPGPTDLELIPEAKLKSWGWT